MMPDTLRCPQCGAVLSLDSVEGQCPKCLLSLAIISETGTLETASNTNPPEAGLEAQFGAYRIVRMLGEGGMGTVYLAEQQHPIRRQAALKVIKLGMSTAEVMARFDSERQAL